MLQHLHLTNIAIIEEAALDFEAGLSVITGETGSGKSLLLTGLRLLTGARSTPSLLRSGAKCGSVEAIFILPSAHSIHGALKEKGLEGEENGEILLRREIMASGRSRSSINGRLVPLAALEEIAELLIDAGRQGEQNALLKPEVQRRLFDAFTGQDALLHRLHEVYESYQKAQETLEDLLARDRNREEQLEFLRFQVRELDELEIRAGEMAELERDRERLGHLDDLMERASAIGTIMEEGAEQCPAVAEILGRMEQLLGGMAERDATLTPAWDAFLTAKEQLLEVGNEVSRYAHGLEADPRQLDQIEARLDQLKKLTRRYGSEESVLERLETMRAEVEALENWEDEVSDLRKKVNDLRKELGIAASKLTKSRQEAASDFAVPLQAILRDFSMPKATVVMSFPPRSNGAALEDGRFCGPDGAEAVEILFSANSGEKPQPLRQVASGGELSRILLALRTLDADQGSKPLIIFDEVDAGISGEAVRRVAERLAALGQRSQVLCVTHNPTVASLARQHIMVTKEESGGRTQSIARCLEGNERKDELARLLDGGKRSRKGLALAGEMLREAV